MAKVLQFPTKQLEMKKDVFPYKEYESFWRSTKGNIAIIMEHKMEEIEKIVIGDNESAKTFYTNKLSIVYRYLYLKLKSEYDINVNELYIQLLERYDMPERINATKLMCIYIDGQVQYYFNQIICDILQEIEIYKKGMQ